jgi:hypothetical protein
VAKKPIAILTDAQLEKIIDDRHRPEMATLTKAVLSKMRRRLPGATELVYDKKNSLVIGFCSTDRAGQVINSIATYSKWINLFFFEGDALPDPEGLLKGSGTMVRSLRVAQAAELDRPAVKALIAAAERCAEPPLDRKAKRVIVLRQATRRS